MAENVRERGVPLELAVAALVAASAVPLSRLISGGGLGATVVSSLVVSLGLAWGWRRLRLPAALSVGLSILALIWFAAGVFAPTTLWGLFPTVSSLHQLADVIAAGNNSVIEEVAPVLLSDGIRLFVTAGVWVTATMIDLAVVRARSPLLGITFAIPMFVIPGILLDSDRRVLEMLLFLATAGLVLFFDERSRTVGWGAIMGRRRPGWRAGPAMRLGAAASAAAVVLMPLLPGYGAEPGLRGRGAGGDRVAFNPLVAIKPTLDRSPHRILFSVESPRPLYYRLTSLDAFEGEVWRDSGRQEEVPLGAGDVPRSTRSVQDPITQRFRIDALAGSWLPAAYEPVAVQGMDDVMLQLESRALVVDRQLSRGTTYTVLSFPPHATPGLLDGAIDYDGRALGPYLDLPGDVRDQLTPIAREIVGGARTPFRQARALQNHLRGFTYDENVAQGHSFTSILEFLTETQRGYCEQFAGSMAVLARTLGIPSRVVIGFAGGEATGSGSYVVTTEYAHAWVELFFPQAGWVAFEPTPRSGVARVPEYALPPIADPSPAEDPNDQQENPASPGPDPTQDPREPDPGTAGPGDLEGGAVVPGWARPLILLGVVLALAGIAVAGRLLLVRRRVSHAASEREAVRTRYVDFLAWCAAAGWQREPGETPAEHARRLTARVPAAGEPLSRLADAVAEALWAPPNGLDHAQADRAAAAARSALTAVLPRRRRVLAALGWGRWRAG